MKFKNETTVERIMAYVEHEHYEQAETLAALADYLEECFLWDIEFDEV